jgi:glutamate 5-kinase
LLSVGVSWVKGEFSRGDMVLILDPQGQTIARGLVNYSALEASKIMGVASTSIESILGYVAEPELIHRDNLVLL